MFGGYAHLVIRRGIRRTARRQTVKPLSRRGPVLTERGNYEHRHFRRSGIGDDGASGGGGYGGGYMSYQPFILLDSASVDELSLVLKDVVAGAGGATVKVIAGIEDKSTKSMKGTWRMWMKETADFMAANGATMPLMIGKDGKPFGTRPFSAQDAHELFMSQWGGKTLDGDRAHQESADKGWMLSIMNRHQQWCIEKGINLTIPQDGEYNRLRDAA